MVMLARVYTLYSGEGWYHCVGGATTVCVGGNTTVVRGGTTEVRGGTTVLGVVQLW